MSYTKSPRFNTVKEQLKHLKERYKKEPQDKKESKPSARK